MHATFMARPITGEAGSALHVHQSVMDESDNNIFTNEDGSVSEMFLHCIGGLQRYIPDSLLIFAPYANSYRRFLSYWSSPVNLEWAVDNRSVGLRVPDSDPKNRRVENRLGGSDVNPYLALAATLDVRSCCACSGGYILTAEASLYTSLSGAVSLSLSLSLYIPLPLSLPLSLSLSPYFPNISLSIPLSLSLPLSLLIVCMCVRACAHVYV